MLEKKIYSGFTEEIEYIIDYPENFDKNKTYPVMFYIHGYGIVNKGLDYLIEKCPVRRERLPEGSDFIIVAPQCKRQTWIEIFESLVAFIKDIIALPFINDKKVYLSGSSMGGYTSWMLVQTNKQLFTAAVICCGGGNYWAASRNSFNGIPIKAVHGANDTTVLPRESEILAKNINYYGGSVELIIHGDLSHDVWTRTFTDINTYNWLNSFSK